LFYVLFTYVGSLMSLVQRIFIHAIQYQI